MPVPATPLTETSVIETFSSIQGEGVLVGCRQIFIRLPHCNLNCHYCDTPFQPTAECKVEDPPGSKLFRNIPNPVQFDELKHYYSHWIDNAPGVHHSFSVTGGEPLLYAELLQKWLPELRQLLPIYLETNGTLASALEKLLPCLDWISMDIKLESVSGEATDWENHRQFLKTASRTNCYVKIVIGENTSTDELEQAANIVSSVCPTMPLILQPVTRSSKVSLPIERIFTLQQAAARFHDDVRVIPQMHVFLGLM